MEYKRNCPVCKIEITYKQKQGFEQAERKNARCKRCSALATQNTTEAKELRRKQMSGEGNNMHGKSIFDVWKEKYGEEETQHRKEEHARKVSEHNGLGMTGKSLHDVWIEKYGEDIANEKHEEWKKKVARHGEKNGMYGRPSPIGSGNGWSGYYKDIYFRSILELSYLKFLLDNNILFESGELKKHAVKWQSNGTPRNYYCDFRLLDTDEFIEIKPSALTKTLDNVAKFTAAEAQWGQRFKVFTEKEIRILSNKEMSFLYDNGSLRFTVKVEEKFMKSYYERGDAQC